MTLPREPIARAAHLAAGLRLTPGDFDPSEFDRAWTPRAAITHRVDVRAYLPAKQAALRAHASQATADGTVRTLAVLDVSPAPGPGARRSARSSTSPYREPVFLQHLRTYTS